MNNFEQKIFDKFMEQLESDTYSRDELIKKKMAHAVKFFVNEIAIKDAFKNALYELRSDYHKQNKR